MTNPFLAEPEPDAVAAPIPTAADPAPATSLTKSSPADATATPAPDPQDSARPDTTPANTLGDDPTAWGSLWSVMAATGDSGASTLDGWCACSQEIARDPRWQPEPGASPWLVLTATRTVEGVRRARQLAGALNATPARLAAIVLREPAPVKGTSSGGGIKLKEIIAAAEAAGVQIITCPYDPRLHDNPTPPQGSWPWSPRDAANVGVPHGLAGVYNRLFFTILDHETPAKEPTK